MSFNVLRRSVSLVYLEVEHFLFCVQLLPLFFSLFLTYWTKFNQRALVKKKLGGIMTIFAGNVHLIGTFYVILAKLTKVSPKTASDGLY